MSKEIGTIENVGIIDTEHGLPSVFYGHTYPAMLRVNQMPKVRGRKTKVPRKKQAQLCSYKAQLGWNMGFRRWNRIAGLL